MIEDALINTDIDRVISILAQKKRMEIGELAKEANVPVSTLRTWLHTLEEEGYVKLEYKLTKTYVNWLLEGAEGEKVVEEAEEKVKAKEKEEAKLGEEEKAEKRVEEVKIEKPKERKKERG